MRGYGLLCFSCCCSVMQHSQYQIQRENDTIRTWDGTLPRRSTRPHSQANFAQSTDYPNQAGFTWDSMWPIYLFMKDCKTPGRPWYVHMGRSNAFRLQKQDVKCCSSWDQWVDIQRDIARGKLRMDLLICLMIGGEEVLGRKKNSLLKDWPSSFT